MWSGLLRLVTACSALHERLSGRPGFSRVNFAPVGASGVIAWPVFGIVWAPSESSAAITAVGNRAEFGKVLSASTAEIVRRSFNIRSPPEELFGPKERSKATGVLDSRHVFTCFDISKYKAEKCTSYDGTATGG